jgi:hypothetical protein
MYATAQAEGDLEDRSSIDPLLTTDSETRACFIASTGGGHCALTIDQLVTRTRAQGLHLVVPLTGRILEVT